MPAHRLCRKSSPSIICQVHPDCASWATSTRGTQGTWGTHTRMRNNPVSGSSRALAAQAGTTTAWKEPFLKTNPDNSAAGFQIVLVCPLHPGG